MRGIDRGLATTPRRGFVLQTAACFSLLAAPAMSRARAPAFDVQGHRGARGLAPENTLAGFRAALAAGATTWELDIGLSRDGAVVVCHDRRLNGDITRDSSGQWLTAPTPTLHSLSLAELKRFDVGRLRPGSAYAAQWPEQQAADGERLPTLAEVFALARREAPPALRFNIETKLSPLAPEETAPPAEMAEALLAEIDRHGLRPRCTVQSFDWQTLVHLRRQAPDLALSALSARRPEFDTIASGHWTAGLALTEHGTSVPRMVKALGATAWSPQFRDLTPEWLAEARGLGLKVLPWTVNTPADIERLIAWGVDGLISDYPQRVTNALARR
jgi:glycerophosphoryl diester phosphodiesterase